VVVIAPGLDLSSGMNLSLIGVVLYASFSCALARF